MYRRTPILTTFVALFVECAAVCTCLSGGAAMAQTSNSHADAMLGNAGQGIPSGAVEKVRDAIAKKIGDRYVLGLVFEGDLAAVTKAPRNFRTPMTKSGNSAPRLRAIPVMPKRTRIVATRS